MLVYQRVWTTCGRVIHLWFIWTIPINGYLYLMFIYFPFPSIPEWLSSWDWVEISQWRGKCPNWTSPNYWGHNHKQILEHDVQNSPSRTFTTPCLSPRKDPSVAQLQWNLRRMIQRLESFQSRTVCQMVDDIPISVIHFPGISAIRSLQCFWRIP